MLHIFLSNRPGDIRYGTTGKPVPGYDARIIDENGAEVGDEEVGELDHPRAVGGGRLLEPARQEPAAPSRANGPIPATNTSATPTAITAAAAAPTTCSR